MPIRNIKSKSHSKTVRNQPINLKHNKIKAQNLHKNTTHFDIHAKHQYQSF